MSKPKKPKIISRAQIAVRGDGLRGASRMKMITIVELGDGRKMSMAEYRKLSTTEPANDQQGGRE